jgi:hypothetical protein
MIPQTSPAKRFPSRPFFFLILGLFMIVGSKTLLSEGMFMDGLIYATIAKNLSLGIGSFWNPYFTATCMSDFHEHPPLAFGIQSLFYSIFGDALIIDKAYSLFTFLVNAFAIAAIWKRLQLRHTWLPLFLWLSTPTVIWASSNNVLENTMSIFITLSVFFYLRSEENNTVLFLCLSGIQLTLGFLCKGFVALFPWTFPLWMWLSTRQKSFMMMLKDCLCLIFFSLLPLILLFMLLPEALISMEKYMNVQVINSIKNVQTVHSRFYILERLLLDLIPACICMVLLLMAGRGKSLNTHGEKNLRNQGIAFILLGLSGVLPIMISMKQSGFYILATFPFFAIGFGMLFFPFANALLEKIHYPSRRFSVFGGLSYFVFLAGLFLVIYFSGTPGRDQNKIDDTHRVLSLLPEGSIINIHPELWHDWSLQAYYARNKNVSLDPNTANRRKFLLVLKSQFSDTLSLHYTPVNLSLREYALFRRME